MKRLLKEETVGKTLVFGSAAITVSSLVFVLAFTLIKGAPRVSWRFVVEPPRDMGRSGGVLPAVVGTVFLVVLGLAVALPLAVGTGLFLAECLPPYSKIGEIVRTSVEALAAVPSVVFGLFGYALFVKSLKPVTGGTSLLSGAITASLMILPAFIRSVEEALRAVPLSYREASLGLGATKSQTVFRIVLPAALPRIGSATVLGIGRMVGETAALMLTLGGSPVVPRSVFDPARTLAMHLYMVVLEVGAMDVGFATAFLLVILTLGLNALVDHVSKR